MLRFVGSLVALALVFGTGCSGSDEAGGSAAVASGSVEVRSLPEIWADVLKERDVIQVAISKGHEMWHEECAAVSTASGRLDVLAVEVLERTRQMPSVEERRRGIESVMGHFQALISELRNQAIQENVGEMPGLIISLDAFLRGIENHFTPEEIGSDSVATHPAFNPVRPPPPPSPV